MKIHASFRAKGEDRIIDLLNLSKTLRSLPELKSKRAIRFAANGVVEGLSRYAQPGDDCAAFAVESGYQLLAMEGMLPDFVSNHPKSAASSAVMANVSDIAAMGGRATAVVNAYWHHDDFESEKIINSIKKACDRFGVIFSGGHSSIQKGYQPYLAVAIMGHAKKLLSCHHVEAGQRLFLLSDLTGSWFRDLPYWDCVSDKTLEQVRAQWQIPAELAEAELVVAAKDISNGGILGTLLMMLELTGSGATIDMHSLPVPPTTQGNDLLRWLRAFQSFGFLLTVETSKVSQLLNYFKNSHLSCSPIGSINTSGKVQLDYLGQQVEFWDLNKESLTGMGKNHCQV
jgi:AIR synthase-related protein